MINDQCPLTDLVLPPQVFVCPVAATIEALQEALESLHGYY